MTNDVLGWTYIDRVTGFRGVAGGYCEYLSGCNQMLLVPPVGPDGAHRDSQWFDVQRLERLDPERIVLNNTATPGFDKAAPRR